MMIKQFIIIQMILDDGIIVVLMNQGVVEKEQSISDFKKENSIVNDINEQFFS